MATLKTTRQVRADAAAARKKKREELAKKIKAQYSVQFPCRTLPITTLQAKEDAAAAAAAAATADAQGTPQPPAFQKPTVSCYAREFKWRFQAFSFTYRHPLSPRPPLARSQPRLPLLLRQADLL